MNAQTSIDSMMIYMKALNSAKESGDEKTVAESNYHIGRYYFEQAQHSIAVGYLKDARSMAGKLGNTDLELRSLKRLADVNQAVGNHSKVQEYSNAARIIQDSISKVATEQEIAELKSTIAQLQEDAKERPSEEPAESTNTVTKEPTDNKELYLLGLLLVVMVIAMFVILIRLRSRLAKKDEEIKSAKKALSKIESENNELQEVENDFQSARKEVKRSKELVTKLQAKIQTLEATNRKLDGDKKSLEEKLITIETEMAEAEKEKLKALKKLETKETQEKQEPQVETKIVKLEPKTDESKKKEALEELLSKTLYKGALIREMKGQVKGIKSKEPKDAEKELRKFINSKINVGKDWRRLKKRFESAYPNFIAALTGKYSDLTEEDVRDCCYLKLGLSTKEIGTLTASSQKEVRAARTALKDKLGISEKESIRAFLDGFS